MPEIKRYDLKINPLKISATVDKQLLEDFAYQPSKIKEYEDILAERIVYQYERFLAGEKLERISVKYPASAWDHIKQDWMPKWFTKKYPVKYIIKAWDAYAMFPKVTVPKELRGDTISITFLPKFDLWS